MQDGMFGIWASPGTTQGLPLDITYRDIACPEQESQVGVECVCRCCLINDAPQMLSFVVFTLMFSSFLFIFSFLVFYFFV